MYISSCASVKKNHACDATLTTIELYQWMQRACVSRFTQRQIWDTTVPEQPDLLAVPEGSLSFIDLRSGLEELLSTPVSMADGITEAKQLMEKEGIRHYCGQCLPWRMQKWRRPISGAGSSKTRKIMQIYDIKNESGH